MTTRKADNISVKVKSGAKPPGGPLHVAPNGVSSGTLGLSTGDAFEIVRLVRAGFPYSHLTTFQRATGLPWDQVDRLVSIPGRTRTRRKTEGRLRPDESDRVWRASRIFDAAVELFGGNVDRARRWLQSPQRALGGEIPLDFASTEAGGVEVENLMGRLEHGVFT